MEQVQCVPVPAPLLANLFGAGTFFRQVTIEVLSDDTFLKIFRHYLDAIPRFWPTLASVCQRWRRIVFASHRDLNIRLFCIHGTPVLKTLDFWPAALPIVVQYGGSPTLDPPAPEDEDNIVEALKQTDRAISISLTVTSSLLEKLLISAIEGPFSELEDVALLSRDRVQLPSAFLWGPCLRTLHLTGIAFPAHHQLLSSSRGLVDLQLHEVNPSHLLPETLTNVLSGLGQLRSLSLHFLYTDNYLPLPPLSGERIVLPVLNRFIFRGTTGTGYLGCLIDRIDAPRLVHIEYEVTPSEMVVSNLSKLNQFVSRIEMHKSLRLATLTSDEGVFTMALVQPGAPTCFILRIFCKPFSKRRSLMAQICIHFSTFLVNVECLFIFSKRPSTVHDNNDCNQWREVICQFESVNLVCLAGDHLTTILRALDGWGEAVLPSPRDLCVLQPGPPHAHLREAVVALMISRRLSGHPIAVEYRRTWDTGFRDLELLLPPATESGTYMPSASTTAR